MMQLLKPSLVRRCCQKSWIVGVVTLLMLGAYYNMTWDAHDTAASVVVDGFDEYFDKMQKAEADNYHLYYYGGEDDFETSTPENRRSSVIAAGATSARFAVPSKVESQWKTDRQQQRETGADVKDNGRTGRHNKNEYERTPGRISEVGGRRGRKDEEMERGGGNAGDGKSDRELRGTAADDERNGKQAADRNERRGGGDDADAEDLRPRRRATDDVKGVHDHVVGPDYDARANAKHDNIDTETNDINGDVNNENNDRKEVEDDSGKSYDTCDVECQKFRGELASWPSDKPKAFIYYLVHRPAIGSLRKSIRALHDNFNRRFRYPIVVFVEPDLDNLADRRRITDAVPADSDARPPPTIYVQVVRFRIPAYVNASLVPRMAGFGSRKRTIGYRHMCRFHAGGVYEQPIVRSPGLEYVWRLDDDSLIRRPIDYDLFRVMRDGRYQYGYRRINTGWSPVDHALWDEVDRYLNATRSPTPTFYRQWPKNAARYFNNFEVSDLRVWMSPQYRHYFNFVDRLGGIYYHKWGDAAIKTIAVTLFIPRDRTHLFTRIAYYHA